MQCDGPVPKHSKFWDRSQVMRDRYSYTMATNFNAMATLFNKERKNENLRWRRWGSSLPKISGTSWHLSSKLYCCRPCSINLPCCCATQVPKHAAIKTAAEHPHGSKNLNMTGKLEHLPHLHWPINEDGPLDAGIILYFLTFMEFMTQVVSTWQPRQLPST